MSSSNDGYVAHDTAMTASAQGSDVTLTSLFKKNEMMAAEHEVKIADLSPEEMAAAMVSDQRTGVAGSGSVIQIDGIDDLLIKISQCCTFLDFLANGHWETGQMTAVWIDGIKQIG